MTNVQTIAQSVKKPSKSDAQILVLKLQIELMDNPTAINQLAQLYKFFQPALTKKPKTNLQWHNLCLSKDKMRPQLHNCYARDGYLYSTDGTQMYRSKTDLAEGFYDRSGNRLECHELRFPDVERVIANAENSKHKEEICLKSILESDLYTVATTDYFTISNCGIYLVQRDYLLNAIAGFGDVYDTDKMDAFYVPDCNLIYIKDVLSGRMAIVSLYKKIKK